MMVYEVYIGVSRYEVNEQGERVSEHDDLYEQGLATFDSGHNDTIKAFQLVDKLIAQEGKPGPES